MILLDTSVFIRLVLGQRLQPAAQQAILLALRSDGLLVSAVTAWEIGTLSQTGRTGMQFQPDGRRWFRTAVEAPGIRLLPLSPTAAVDAGFLPGSFHRDPADRLLVATAREEGVAFVTNDRQILAYAAAGHLNAISA